MGDLMFFTVAVIVYLFLTAYLGYYGYRKTRNALDYLVAGRDVHPVVMAVSYGATFISTSAIIGFGGVAAMMGMGLLWLTALNIIVGIIVAFIFFGKRTRKMGHNLEAHTFPELLGKRYQSPFIQNFSGLIIFVFMPLYAAAVLIGAARFLESTFPGVLDYNVALLIYALVICAYVFAGGIKGVMYTDALQGAIMFVGMIVLVVLTYVQLGGIVPAHQALVAMAAQVPEKLTAQGHLGWTRMPALGSPLWWTLVSTIVMGVGIGVLAQPQLAVRFMTVKSDKEINRGVMAGGIFILVMTGAAYLVGALSNVYFFNHPGFGKIALAAAGGNVDKVIPLFINSAMPRWFVTIFMLTLLSAAMSTSSSQFHTMGTAIGRDFIEPVFFKGKGQQYTVILTKSGILVGVILTVLLGAKLPTSIIAIATAIFFGLCASTFLPAYSGALFFKWITKTGAIASMLAGFTVTALWFLFVHKKEAEALGLCQALFNRPTLAVMPWTVVDPVLIALPFSFIVVIVVSLFTQKPSDQHLEKCFKHFK
ncbi:MAG: sodium:solute symporter family protein [Candidatus Omnitrophica bacterium]|nr:sodium:solute symporter family protein [Candidatus Omnitrophota bacterium]